jgi:HEAT repeat protein
VNDPQAGVPLVGLLRDEDEAVRKAGASALEHMAGVLDETTAAALASLLYESKDEGIRLAASQLLGVIPNAIAPLCEMLTHQDPEAQIMAAKMLEHLLDPRSADSFINAMGQPAVCDIAVRTLKKLSAIRERIDEVFDELRAIEELSEREEARMSTVINLLAIGRPSVEILIEYLEDDDWVIREAAADLLGLIGDARPAQLYIEAIPIRPLRVYAMEALAKVKDVDVLRPYKELFDRLRTDRDGLVAYNAGLIADKLEALDGTPVGSQGGQGDDE